jgi:hypothetical protein
MTISDAANQSVHYNCNNYDARSVTMLIVRTTNLVTQVHLPQLQILWLKVGKKQKKNESSVSSFGWDGSPFN